MAFSSHLNNKARRRTTHHDLSELKLFTNKSTCLLTRNVRNFASPPPDNFACFSRCAGVPSRLTAAKATKLSNVVGSLWAVCPKTSLISIRAQVQYIPSFPCSKKQPNFIYMAHAWQALASSSRTYFYACEKCGKKLNLEQRARFFPFE